MLGFMMETHIDYKIPKLVPENCTGIVGGGGWWLQGGVIFSLSKCHLLVSQVPLFSSSGYHPLCILFLIDLQIDSHCLVQEDVILCIYKLNTKIYKYQYLAKQMLSYSSSKCYPICLSFLHENNAFETEWLFSEFIISGFNSSCWIWFNC